MRFEAQGKGISSGRFPDGAADFHRLATKTLGATNGALRIGDVVINEIMFRPISDNNDDEYVELHNRSTNTVDLGGWRLVDGINFSFPANWPLPGGGYAVVAANISRFQTNYSNLGPSNLIGNFSESLDNGGERIALAMPAPIITTNTNNVVITNFNYVVVDEVTPSLSGMARPRGIMQASSAPRPQTRHLSV